MAICYRYTYVTDFFRVIVGSHKNTTNPSRSTTHSLIHGYHYWFTDTASIGVKNCDESCKLGSARSLVASSSLHTKY